MAGAFCKALAKGLCSGSTSRSDEMSKFLTVKLVVGSYSRLPSNLGLKRVPFFCLKGFRREPKPPQLGNKGTTE